MNKTFFSQLAGLFALIALSPCIEGTSCVGLEFFSGGSLVFSAIYYYNPSTNALTSVTSANGAVTYPLDPGFNGADNTFYPNTQVFSTTGGIAFSGVPVIPGANCGSSTCSYNTWWNPTASTNDPYGVLIGYVPSGGTCCQNLLCTLQFVATPSCVIGSASPSTLPSAAPTATPTIYPTLSPSVSPTVAPSVYPSVNPSIAPTASPTVHPTIYPSPSPSLVPTNPTAAPTLVPSLFPTAYPSDCSQHADGVVTLLVNGNYFNVYCKSNKVLLAKINGGASTWQYSSSLWTTNNDLNPTSLSFDQTEAKLDAYNLFPINALHVCMSDISSSITNYNCLDLSLGQTYSSLLAVMTATQSVSSYGSPQATQYTGIITSAGRNAWLAMLGLGVTDNWLEDNCNVEGINTSIYNSWTPGWWTYTRIGIIGNNENDCLSNDSVLGFGVSCTGNSHSAGSVSLCCPGVSSSNRFGYIYGSGCPAGSVPVSGSMSCISCSAGYYVSGATCIVCPAGQFQPGSGQTACTHCPTGYYSNAGYTYCFSPTMTPTLTPTSPTHRPTHPTNSPTTKPTTRQPTTGPSKKPSRVPTSQPTTPTVKPTGTPTLFTNYLAAFTTIQGLSGNGVTQATLQSTAAQKAFVAAVQQLLNTNHSKYLVSVSILSVVSVVSGYGYAYNTSYVVPNGLNSNLIGSYHNLSTAIATATASNSVASVLTQTCQGCGLPSSLTLGSASFSNPAYIQTPTPTSAPSSKPIFPSVSPSTFTPTSPSARPSLIPSSPTVAPSKKPTLSPSVRPSRLPTSVPSIRSLAPTNQGQCFCNVRFCATIRNVTQCGPGQVDVYH